MSDYQVSYKVFLSYRTRDAAIADLVAPLKAYLECQFGEGVFLDRQSICGGSEWRPLLREALRNTKVLVVLIGEESKWLGSDTTTLQDEDDWVREEIAAALERKIPILPLLCYESSTIPYDQLPEALKDIEKWQTHSFRSWIGPGSEESFAALVPLIARHLHGPGPSHERLLEILFGVMVRKDGAAIRLGQQHLPRGEDVRRLYQASLGWAKVAERLRGTEAADLRKVINHLSQFSGTQLCRFAVGLRERLQGNGDEVSRARGYIEAWLEPWVESEQLPGFTKKLKQQWEADFQGHPVFRLQVVANDQPRDRRAKWRLSGSLRCLEKRIPILPIRARDLESAFHSLIAWLDQEFGAETIDDLPLRLEVFATTTQMRISLETLPAGSTSLGERLALCYRLYDRHFGDLKMAAGTPERDFWRKIETNQTSLSEFADFERWEEVACLPGEGFLLLTEGNLLELERLLTRRNVVGVWCKSERPLTKKQCLRLGSEGTARLPEQLRELRHLGESWRHIAILYDRPDEDRLPLDLDRQAVADHTVLGTRDLLQPKPSSPTP